MGAPALCEAGKMTAASATPQPPPPTPSPPPPLSANMKQKHGPGRNADSHIRGVAEAVIGVCLAVRDVEGAAVAPESSAATALARSLSRLAGLRLSFSFHLRLHLQSKKQPSSLCGGSVAPNSSLLYVYHQNAGTLFQTDSLLF